MMTRATKMNWGSAAAGGEDGKESLISGMTSELRGGQLYGDGGKRAPGSRRASAQVLTYDCPRTI